jgi:pyruvate/2-oxoglutarate dehydrogenase complex dihydrolipoamide dehydrogenase (E3) component
MKKVDVGVIGSGQGGVPLAIDLAAAGRSVVLFERGKLGGSCVNYGCTPSKSLLASAHAAGRARRAAAIGIHAEVRIDFKAVMTRVGDMVNDWNTGVEEKIGKSKVELVRGEASFLAPHVILAAAETWECTTIVLNTGTSPAIPPIDGIDTVPYRTNLDIWDLRELPATTAVIGAGYIGLELGQGLARLGSNVTLIDTVDRVLAAEEPDVSAAIARSLTEDGVTLRLGRTIRRAAKIGSTIELTLDNGTLQADLLLIAAGRKPNIPGRAVERGGIELDGRGYVDVDAQLRTNVPGVYALGDVAGQPQFTHVSWEDYRRMKATLLGGQPRERDDRVLAYGAFTEPQVGRVGMTADQARRAGKNPHEVTLPLSEVARAIEWGETNGFYRLVVDRASDEILGATFVGDAAAELVHIILAHMENGSRWQMLAGSVHIHPTYAEALPTLARMVE